jgi:hypothetical protein
VSERVRGRLSDLCHTVMGVRAACCLDTMRCSATAREARFREDSFALPCGGGWMLWRTGERGCHGCHLVFLQPMTCLHAWWEGCPTGRVLGSCVRGTRTHTTHTRHTHTHARHTHTHTHTHTTRHTTHTSTHSSTANQPTNDYVSLSFSPSQGPSLVETRQLVSLVSRTLPTVDSQPQRRLTSLWLGTRRGLHRS